MFTFAILPYVLLGGVEAGRIATHQHGLEMHNSTAGVRVEVLLVRQGHSCGNALFQQGEKAGKTGKLADAKALPKSVKYLDAPLTDCGQHQSKLTGKQMRDANKKKNWQADFVLTSSLLRSMETAAIMFPGNTLYPVPFQREHAVGPFRGDLNKPRPLDEQLAIMKTRKDVVDWKFTDVSGTIELSDTRLKTRKMRASGQKVKYSPKAARASENYVSFRAYLGEHVIPALMAEKPGSTLRLAVVGHGNFFKKMLAKHFECKTPFINNDGMFAMYDYDAGSQQLAEVIGNGSCEKPLDPGPWVNWEKPFLCVKDYSRCSDHQGDRFMGATDLAGIGSEYVSTVADDSSKGGCCVDQTR